MTVHPSAATGFERGADDYERSRPSYPPKAVAYVRDRLELTSGRMLLDLAAGTGKFTRLVAVSACDLIAVEPVAGMRQQLSGILPQVPVISALAEALPLADQSVDAVTVAQAFHWFDESASLAEIGRVLRPGGSLALIWNVRDESVPWVRAFTEIVIEGGGGTPYRRDYTFERWVEVFATAGMFGPLEAQRFSYQQPTTIDLVVDRAASTSFVSALPDSARADVLTSIRTMLEHDPTIAASGGNFTFPHHTDVFVCSRRS